MEFLTKFEELFNRFVLWLVEKTKEIYFKIYNSGLLKKLAPIKHFFLNFKEKIGNLKTHISSLKQLIAQINIKEEINFFIEKTKDTIAAIENSDLGGNKEKIKAIFRHFKSKIEEQVKKIEWSPEKVFVTTIGLGLVFLSILKIFISSKSIMVKVRQPSAVVEVKKGVRPEYYKQEEKQYHINHFKLPIYIGDSKKHLRAIQIEFTVQSSNRFVKNFLEDYDFQTRDFLNVSLEPIIPEFSLEDEGKVIIKEKIKRELNNLLKMNKIEGEVLEVSIKDLITD